MATPPPVVEGEGRRVNPAVLAGIVVGAIVVLAALWFLVIKPLIAPTEEAAPPPAATTPAPRPSPTPSPTKAPAETFEVFGSKDPFRPLVVAGAPGGSPAPAPTSTGAAGGSVPSGTQRVALLDIFQDQATTRVQVRVGSTVYTVGPGEVFAGTFKVLSVSGNCATLLNGDDKFTLCKGEEVIK